MANSLVKTDKTPMLVEYDSNGEKVKLTLNIVRRYLVSGGGNVSNEEIVMFINLCKFQHLNPYLREAYLIKFGTYAATLVTGKDVFLKRARRNTVYAGNQAGVIVQKTDGTLENRVGALVLKEESLVGGWAKVYVKGDEVPTEITISFDEYVGKKSNGEINQQWSIKPATMIRKVALVQALREAFPEELRGLYAQEEVYFEDQPLEETPITQDEVQDTDFVDDIPEEELPEILRDDFFGDK